MRGVTPLHMAADLNSKEGVVITKMLLTCLVNADTRALDDGTYLHLNLVFPFAVMISVFFSEWWGAGVVICVERNADLHTAQVMPLPLTVSCCSKIEIGFTFLVVVPAHPGSPGKNGH